MGESLPRHPGKQTVTRGIEPDESWDATWEGARRQLLRSIAEAAPSQRLAWLEEALEIAFRAKTQERRKDKS